MHGSQLDISSPESERSVTAESRHRGLLREIIRFGITGVLNTSWCLAILFVLHRKFGVDLWVASYTGYAIATVHSFLVNKYWTFAGDHHVGGGAQFIGFVIMNVIGSTIFSTGVNLLTPLTGLEIASIASTAVTMVFNFFGARLFIFRKAAR